MAAYRQPCHSTDWTLDSLPAPANRHLQNGHLQQPVQVQREHTRARGKPARATSAVLEDPPETAEE